MATKVCALTLLLVLGAFSLGRASAGVKFDAPFWASLAGDARLRFVQGLTDGASLGYADGYIDGVKASFEKADEDVTIIERTGGAIPIDELTAATHKRLIVQRTELLKGLLSAKTTPPNFPDTFGDYVDTVTRFYAGNPTTQDSPAAILMRPSGK